MEKFRKWTDQATGVNPFISSKKSPSIFSIDSIMSLIFILVRIPILIILHPLILGVLAIMMLQQNIAITSNIFIAGWLNTKLWKLINMIFFGMWGLDDDNFTRTIQKHKSNKKSGKLFISNHCSPLDVLYYLSRIPNLKFIVSSSNQEQFVMVGGLSIITRLFTKRQPFFEPNLKGRKYKQLVNKQLQSGNNCMIFYEGIRTNGMGTIKISNKMSKYLYQNQTDFCICHLKYYSTDSIHSMVHHPLRIIFGAMGYWQIKIRVRSRIQSISKINSGTQLQKQIDIFLTANATKLLDTMPADYFDFLQYYRKCQKQGYTQK